MLHLCDSQYRQTVSVQGLRVRLEAGKSVLNRGEEEDGCAEKIANGMKN